MKHIKVPSDYHEGVFECLMCGEKAEALKEDNCEYPGIIHAYKPIHANKIHATGLYRLNTVLADGRTVVYILEKVLQYNE